MTFPLRALSCSLVVLLACTEPPSGGEAKSAPAPTPTSAPAPAKPLYPIDPVFEGKPVSNATLDGGL